jgi:hypothetical protein
MGTTRIKWAGAAGAAVLGGVMILAPVAASASTLPQSSVSAAVTTSAAGGTHMSWDCAPADTVVSILDINIGLGDPCS